MTRSRAAPAWPPALLDAAEARARERGCHLLRLESGHARSEAHALYAARGFTDGGVSYLLPLDPG